MVKQQQVHLSRYLEYAVRGANLWQRVCGGTGGRFVLVWIEVKQTMAHTIGLGLLYR